MPVIWGKREGKYFLQRDWTTQIRLNRLKKFVFTRNGVTTKKALPLIHLIPRLVPIEFVIGRKRPVAGGQLISSPSPRKRGEPTELVHRPIQPKAVMPWLKYFLHPVGSAVKRRYPFSRSSHAGHLPHP
jgi:hypothetical protein